MSSALSISPTALNDLQRRNSNRATKKDSIGSGLTLLQDHPANQSFAAQLRSSSPFKDSPHHSVGAITEGHYTEF